MNKKSKLAAIALVAALGVATPVVASAQGLETGTAANREQLFGYGPSRGGFSAYAQVPSVPYRGGLARVHRRSQQGPRAYDMVPGPAFGSDSPSATGGGSIGYNSYVGRDS